MSKVRRAPAPPPEPASESEDGLVDKPAPKARGRGNVRQAPVVPAPEPVVAGEGEKKPRRKNRPPKSAKVTTSQYKSYKAIKAVLRGDTSSYKIARSVFKAQFLRRFDAARRERDFPITFSKGVLRRIQLGLDQRMMKINLIAARALDEFGRKKCYLSTVRMARDIYDLAVRNGSIHLSWYDRLDSAYMHKLAKYREGREAKKVAGGAAQ